MGNSKSKEDRRTSSGAAAARPPLQRYNQVSPASESSSSPAQRRRPSYTEQEVPRAASPKAVRKSLTQDLSHVKSVNQMQIQTDYNKPLTEAEPYLVQVR